MKPADAVVSTTVPIGALPGSEAISHDAEVIVNAAPGGVYATDLEGRATLVNDAAARLLGWTTADLIGRTLHDVIHHTRPDGSPYPIEECPLHRTLRDGATRPAEEDVYWRKDGTSIPIEFYSHAIHRDGLLVGALVTFYDITERRRNEDRTHQLVREQFARAKAEFEHAQLQEVFAQAPALICVTRGPRHVIETANDQYISATGAANLVGKTMAEAFPASDGTHLALLDEVFASGTTRRGEEASSPLFTGATPSARRFNYVIQPLRDENGTVYGLLTHAVDVTAQVRERQILLVQHRLSELIARVGLILTGADSLQEALQACAEAVVAHTDAALVRIWTLDDDEQTLELQASAGMYIHRDGVYSRVPIGRFEIGLIAQERKPQVTNQVIGDPRIGDQEWARREGMVSFAGYPLVLGRELVGVLAMFGRRSLDDADLQALGAVAYSLSVGIQRKRSEDALRVSERDLRKRAEELARLASALERSNQELDAFAYAASHDLRAPLRGIANLAQWIEEDLSDQLHDETREMLALMRSRMHRMEGLIQGLLEYSRAGRVHHDVESVDTARVVHDAVDLLSPPAAASVTLAPDLPTVICERLPLQQVFLNLIGNALKHANRIDPNIAITARDAGEFYEFAVADNGPGIAPQFQERIWGIFQTLEARDTTEGTGIGLALVRKLVESQGGRVWVESTPGAGATFRFRWRK